MEIGPAMTSSLPREAPPWSTPPFETELLTVMLPVMVARPAPLWAMTPTPTTPVTLAWPEPLPTTKLLT